MTWWNSAWTKKKPITLTGGASGSQTAYQVKLTVTYDSDMKSDFSDLRFTNGTEDALIDAWLESKVDDTSAEVWVEFPTTPENTVEQTYYMYYGNSGASSDWDGGKVFEFYDDFEGISWEKDSANPVIEHSVGANDEDNYQLYDGKIIDYNTTHWRMYYTANQQSACKDQIFMATSAKTNNFKNWTKHTVSGDVTPVLGVGNSGEFDDQNVYHGTVIKESDTSYKMWYLGDDKDQSPWHRMRIGYATSSDGISWTKYNTIGIYEDFSVSSHGIDYVNVWKEDSTHYYAAISHYIVDRVDLLQSSDGISWSSLATNVITTIQPSELKKIDGIYYIYGCSKNDYTRVKCYSATSISGTWTDRGTQLTAVGSGWEQRTYHSTLLEISTGEYLMTYSGWDGSIRPEIGIATLTNSVPYVQLPDTNKWTDPDNTTSVSDGIMTVVPTAGYGIHTNSQWNRNVSFRAKLKRDSIASSGLGFMNGWGSDPGIHFRYDSGGNKLITYGGGSYTLIAGTASLNTYKTVDIHWITDSATFIVDGVEEVNSPITTYVSTLNSSVGFHGTDNSKMYAEWVVVRKYVTNPATYAFGGEETKTGWTGKIIGVTNPAKVIGIIIDNIASVIGV